MPGRILLLLVITALLYALPAYSQDEDEYDRETSNRDTILNEDSIRTEVKEVVITGTRTYKQIIDIPYSVFRVKDEEIKFGRNVIARDLLNDVPGLFLQTRYGNDVRISIRGFGTRSNTGIKGIRILLDGIPESDPDGETSIDAIDFTTLGGVEVVKGNLSSLYTNSPGGVINFITDMNFSRSYVRSLNEIGAFGLSMNGIQVGANDVNSKLFASYNYRNIDGYRKHSNEYRHLLNAVYKSFPNSSSSLTVSVNATDGLQKLPGSLTREEFDQDPSQAYFQAVSSDFKRISQKGRLAVTYRKLFGKNNIHDFEFTGFGTVRNLEFTTNVLYNIRQKYVLGTMARYIGTSPVLGRQNEFTAGVDYFYVTGPLNSYDNVAGQKGDQLQAQLDETQFNIGAYLQDQINIMKGKLYFLASGRYDKVGFINEDLLFGARNSERTFERFTPKIGLNYKLRHDVAIYSSFGWGFDTPSTSEMENFPGSSNNGFTTLNPDINPQTSKNFEIGIKGSILDESKKWFPKFVFEVTLFNAQIDNEIIPFTITDRTYFRNAAKTNRTGVECGFKVEPIRKFDVIVNYTYTDFKYDQYIARTYNQQGIPIDADYSGNRVPSVPQHLVNFILETERHLTENIEGFFLVDCDYVSGMFVDDQNTEKTSDYFYANFITGFDWKIGNASILLSGGMNNIFDKKFVGFININANPEFPQNQRRYYEPGETRSFFTKLNISYRL